MSTDTELDVHGSDCSKCRAMGGGSIPDGGEKVDEGVNDGGDWNDAGYWGTNEGAIMRPMYCCIEVSRCIMLFAFPLIPCDLFLILSFSPPIPSQSSQGSLNIINIVYKMHVYMIYMYYTCRLCTCTYIHLQIYENRKQRIE